MDHQSRPSLRQEKKQRDRLLRLAATHAAWGLGFADAVWWSRLAQPALHSWVPADTALHLVEKTVPQDDPEPKALACYGLLLRPSGPTPEQLWLRFVPGQPVSAHPSAFLTWCCERLAALGKRALLMVWDNASWPKSQAVRTGRRAHNRQVKQTGRGVRVVACLLPSKSPWLNPIEAKGVHGKRAVMEPERVLTAQEVIDRVYAYYDCVHAVHLPISKKAA